MARGQAETFSAASAGTQLGGQDIIEFKDFEGMSTQVDRHALPENKLNWCENLQPIGPNNLVVVGNPAATLTTLSGETITRQFFEPINGIDYLICFCVSGAAYAVNLADGSQIKFANAGTFSTKPDVTNWNRQRILMADATAGYSTWDGTLFVHEGGVSPNIIVTNGGMYSGTPTVTISGGSGSGATAVANMTAGVVTSITLTSAGTGYLAGDVLIVTFSGGSPAPGVLTNLKLTNGGNGYTSIPTVVFTPSGAGSGGAAQALVTVSGGPVTTLTLTNPGSGYDASVAVSFTGGGGANAAATVDVTTLASATAVVWPFITHPTTIAVFQGRVFMATGSTITYTGTQGFSDVSPANAAGTFNISDTDLITTITALRSLNNYLYILGDNSVKQIGNLTVTSLNITEFTLVTLSSDQGTTFMQSIISYNRLLIFSNTVGVYAVYGSSVDKISDDMDGVFRLIDFTQEPCGAVNDINNIHTLMMLVKYNDPLTTTRSIIMAFMQKRWFIISQGNALESMTTAVINGVTETFATSGNDITQIIQDYTTPTPVLLRTALSPHGKAWLGKSVIQYAVAQKVAVGTPITLTVESERTSFDYNYTPQGALITFVGSGPIQFQSNTFQDINFIGGDGFTYTYSSQGSVAGVYLGATLQGSVKDFSLNTIMLKYKDGALFGSSR